MTSLKSFSVSMLLTAALLPSSNASVARDVAMYMDGDFTGATTICYDITYMTKDVRVKNPILSYYSSKANDAAKVWEDYAEEDKTTCMGSQPAGIIFSLNFGDDAEATWKTLDATEFATTMKDYLPLHKYTGLDFSPDNLETGCVAAQIDKAVEITQALNTALPDLKITHSPLASYFSTTAMGFCGTGGKSYLDVEATAGTLISKYYVQYYNVGDAYTYSTYDLIFTNAGDGADATKDGLGGGSAFCEIVAKNSALGTKVVVGKTLVQNGGETSGFLAPGDLNTIICEAETTIGYPNGVMFFRFSGTIDSTVYNNIASGCLVEGTGLDCSGTTTTASPPVTTGAMGAITVSMMTVGAMGVVSLF